MWILNKNGPRIEPWGASCDQWGVTHPASLTPAGLHRGRRSRWGAAPPRLLLILLLWQHHPTVEHQQTQCPPQEHPEQRTSAHTHTHTHTCPHTHTRTISPPQLNICRLPPSGPAEGPLCGQQYEQPPGHGQHHDSRCQLREGGVICDGGTADGPEPSGH